MHISLLVQEMQSSQKIARAGAPQPPPPPPYVYELNLMNVSCAHAWIKAIWRLKSKYMLTREFKIEQMFYSY